MTLDAGGRRTLQDAPIIDDERRIEGEGVPEAKWIASGRLGRLPRLGARTLLSGCARLVVVAPHPDDEVLGAGGLIALAVSQGMRVHVVALTDGEACYPDEPGWTPGALRTARRAELAEALRRLGADPAEVTHAALPDGGLTAHGGQIVRVLANLLQHDDCVLTTWSRDGHPDHESAAAATRVAAAAQACRLLEFPVWGWHWADPGSDALPQSRMRRLDLPRDAHVRKRWALRAFTSQNGRGPVAVRDCILPPWALARFTRDFEVFLQ